MTNESPRINPAEDCKGCGECCESFEIAYPNLQKKRMTAAEETFISEIDRFKALATIGEKLTTREEGDVIWLVFNFPCIHLNPDKTCAIYDSPFRPVLCRRFPHQGTTKESCRKVRE